MKYAIDTEFIDTSSCSALISLAVVREDGAYRYYELEYPKDQLTPWLLENVIPHLEVQPGSALTVWDGALWAPDGIAADLRGFINKAQDPHPEFWAYYATYDWYWLCRVMGGMMNLPDHWPNRPKEFADYGKVEQHFLPKHHALADARSLMKQMHSRGVLARSIDAIINPYDPDDPAGKKGPWA
jgi:hypothetical protein